jgi:hypothetical protein
MFGQINKSGGKIQRKSSNNPVDSLQHWTIIGLMIDLNDKA